MIHNLNIRLDAKTIQEAAHTEINSLQTDELTRGRNSDSSQLYPKLPEWMLVEYFSTAHAASPALLQHHPSSSSSASRVWAGRWSLMVPAAISEEWFPPDHFHTRSQVTGTKSWHKSLTPAPSTHPPHKTGMCQPVSYRTTLPASSLRRNRVSCAF